MKFGAGSGEHGSPTVPERPQRVEQRGVVITGAVEATRIATLMLHRTRDYARPVSQLCGTPRGAQATIDRTTLGFGGRMDRATVIEEMYQRYLDAHDLLVAGTMPSEIAELAEFSSRMDEATVFYVQALDLELRGRAAIEHFMVESRQAMALREVPERVLEHGNLVVSFNRGTITGAEGEASFPVVAVFQFDGHRISGCWGFAG